MLPFFLLPLFLSYPPLIFAHILTLALPSTHPLLPPSTRAHLTTHHLALTTPITTKNDFVFRNLTTSGTYNLDVYCRDYDIEPAIVAVGENKEAVEVYRRKPTGGRGSRLMPGEGGKVELKVKGRREYYEGRDVFSLTSMLKSPMILMALVGLGLVFGMPYLMDNMDPEMRKEFEEQQKKSVLGNAAGGGNPLQSFDMAGWMAGQTAGKTEPEPATANAKERGESSGGRSGGGGGQGKGRRRG
ncbi:MAG: hypothetical protein Q9201_004391 [Fulgogasparrea decipioides]